MGNQTKALTGNSKRAPMPREELAGDVYKRQPPIVVNYFFHEEIIPSAKKKQQKV